MALITSQANDNVKFLKPLVPAPEQALQLQHLYEESLLEL